MLIAKFVCGGPQGLWAAKKIKYVKFKPSGQTRGPYYRATLTRADREGIGLGRNKKHY